MVGRGLRVRVRGREASAIFVSSRGQHAGVGGAAEGQVAWRVVHAIVAFDGRRVIELVNNRRLIAGIS